MRLRLPVLLCTPLLALALPLAQAFAQEALLDSATVLQEAVAAGGSYRLAAGTYELDRPWRVVDDLTIVGDGAADTVLRFRAGPLAVLVQDGATLVLEGLALVHADPTPGDLIRVEDAAIELIRSALWGAVDGPDPSGQRPFGLGVALTLEGEASASLRQSTLQDHGLIGLLLRDGATAELRDSNVLGSGLGIYADADSRLEVRNSLFQANDLGALRAAQRAQVLIQGSHFQGNGALDAASGAQADGLRLSDEARVRLEGNRFVAHPRYTISADQQVQLSLLRNHFEGNGGFHEAFDLFTSPILLDGAASLRAEGDVFAANPGGAMELNAQSSAEMVGVRIEGNASWAHTYVSGQASLLLQGSWLLGNEGGIYLGGQARLRLLHSELRGSHGDDALMLRGAAQAQLEGNLFEGNALRAVYAFEGASLTLSGNRILGSRSGLVLEGAASARLEDNEISGHERSGVAFFDQARGLLRGNTIADNGYNGVLVGGGAEVELVGNSLLGNLRVGVYFEPGSRGGAEGNTITGSAMGILIGQAAEATLGDNVFDGNGEDVVRD